MRRCIPAALLCACSAFGQLSWSGSVRTRVEAWDWFKGEGDSRYLYSGSTVRFGVARQTRTLDWQLEAEVPVLLGLPDLAVAPGTQGQLGLGSTYFVSNHRSRNAALPFLKQAFLRFKNLDQRGRQTLRIGRFEFVDGAETTPKHATLAAVKRDRVAHRLLGNFGFSHVGRSFDGIQYVYSGGSSNFTLLGAAPTRGVFQVDGWGPLPVGVLYGAYTYASTPAKRAAEFRLFGMYYNDWRTPLKTDNRPLVARTADSNSVRLAMVGGHQIAVWETKKGVVDTMLWTAIQVGKWGVLDHRAAAYAAEIGFQPAALADLRPWIRGGFHESTGDADESDDKHGTFFQVLPTPRVYARFPFYNLMNNQDAFAELILRPHARLNVRSDVHWLWLTRTADLWYQGGGAFQPWTFGYVGRPSGGNRALATVIDVSADYQIAPHTSLSAYFAHARGAGVIRSIYPKGKNANLGYLELTYRF